MSFATWMKHLHQAMFEDRVKYLGNGQWSGVSMLQTLTPKQLTLQL